MSLVGFLSSKTLQIYFSTSAFLTRGSPSVSFEFFLWNKRKSYCKQCFINVRHEECGGGNFEGHIYSVERMYGINIFLISRLDLLVQPCFPYPMGRRFQWKESPLVYTAEHTLKKDFRLPLWQHNSLQFYMVQSRKCLSAIHLQLKNSLFSIGFRSLDIEIRLCNIFAFFGLK
jgi:hypothetical protein